MYNQKKFNKMLFSGLTKYKPIFILAGLVKLNIYSFLFFIARGQR